MARHFALALTLVAIGSSEGRLAGQAPTSPPAPLPNAAASKALVVRSNDRPAVPGTRGSCNGSIRFLVNSEDTGGAFSMVESTTCGLPVTTLHQHPNMDEAFYV